jgi:ABC-type multidrug transport system fused ATPase/permease subunit
MKKLLVYLKDYKKESILGPLFKLLEAAFELLVPLVMAAIIDKGIGNMDKAYILKMCFVMIALGIIGLFFSITAQYFAAKAAVGFSTQLRHALFHHIQTLSFSEVDTIGTSTMITRMTSDVNQVQNGVNIVLRLFLRSPFIVLGAMIMAFTIDVKAALVFAVTIPVLSVVVFGIMIVSIPLYKKVQERLDKVLGITRENLTGARVIRAFAKEEEEISQFEKNNLLLTHIQMVVGRISGLMNPSTYIIINIAMVILIWIGAVRVDGGVITQGAVVALVNYMSQILVELIKLANLIMISTKSVACGNRIQAIFEMLPSLTAPKVTISSGKNIAEDTIVAFEQVSLRYKNASEEALTDIDFKVKRGQTIGIIGGTGSGKSSLVNMIPRFYDASNGRILIDGIDVKEYSLDSLRAKIGVVMQKAVLFKGTIRENLCFGKEDATEEELYHALEIAQAKEFVDTKEGGLEFPVAQRGKNLSGGQKQRLTIARALVRKPDILILDDSASALDFATDAKLRKAIQQMQQQLTVFIVSQRASSIQYADQIIVLEDGEIAGIGTHKQLLDSCSVYQEIYYSQFKKEV